MPSYTLSEVMSLATTRAGRRADIGVSDLSKFVNMAYLEVWNAAPSMYQERIAVSSTTSGENRIDLPSDFMEPIDIRLGIRSSATTPSPAAMSYRTVDRISLSQIDANWSDSVGLPKYISFFNSWMEIYPSPDSAYSIQLRYRSGITDMTATTDIPSLTTPWRHAVLLRTEQFVHEYVGDYNGAAYANQRYLNYVSQLKTDEAKRQSGELRLYAAPVYTGVERSRWPRPSIYSYNY